VCSGRLGWEVRRNNLSIAHAAFDSVCFLALSNFLLVWGAIEESDCILPSRSNHSEHCHITKRRAKPLFLHMHSQAFPRRTGEMEASLLER
jgi:hypothetical protein